MSDTEQLIALLRSGGGDAALRPLYAPDGKEAALAAARERAERAARLLAERFAPAGPCALYSAPGRTELGGNHTDHQGGRVLCAAVDLDLLCCAAPNDLMRVRLYSEGFGTVEVPLEDLAPRPEEQGSPAALIRGVAAGFAERGLPLRGFDGAVLSAVPVGSGLSSSAAFELLLGVVFNTLCGGALSPTELAMIGQRAENAWFGKPCGLMDQLGSAVGGAVAVDFRDAAAPRVEPLAFDPSAADLALCLVDTGSDHADLTEDYAAIPREMGAVAAACGKRLLSELPEAEFRAALPRLRERVGDRAVLRALHFYGEDRRAAREAGALRRGDTAAFLSLVNESGLSSQLLLQNSSAPADPRRQAIPLALALGRELLAGEGAIRVHGGGFAGTVLAFVPTARLASFRAGMEAVFGPGCCKNIAIRSHGACVVRIGG